MESPFNLSNANSDMKGTTRNTMEAYQTALSRVKLTGPAAKQRKVFLFRLSKIGLYQQQSSTAERIVESEDFNSILAW